MDSIYALGIFLMVLGIGMFVFGRKRANSVRVSASHGSIAVGGGNFGNITNTSIGSEPSAAPGGHGSHVITVIAILVEVCGIGVTIWHAVHLAAK